jgi:predicted enzyme related to lactoylglutathione lyase
MDLSYEKMAFPNRSSSEINIGVMEIKVECIDRCGILVPDRKEAWKYFGELFETEFDDMGECHYTDILTGCCPFGLEIYEPLSPNGIVKRALEKRGPGFQHIAIKVPDCEKTIQEWKDRGIRFLTRPIHGRTIEATFHPADTYGVLFELIEFHQRHDTLIEGQRPVRTPEEIEEGLRKQQVSYRAPGT